MEAEQKKILKPLVLTLRHLLEGRYDEHGIWHGGDLEARMNSLGVWWDRDSIPADEVTYQSAEDRHAREVIDAYLTLREEAGIDRKAAIEEFVRETAYTWANRLLVLRCMEARDLIDPQVVLTKEVYGGRSQAHNRLVQRHPERCSGPDGGLFVMLEEAFAQHARHLPLLFDPKAPGVALRPSVAALKKCIGLLSGTETVNGNGPATDEVFAAPDALGWAYQYWNTEEKDRVFEKVRTKKAKIQGADIIPATQLYTEPYMVKFLVQNSLGATWMGMYPDSALSESWEYYVKDADRAPVRKKNVENITFLDPACGSGHFLIEAFDLFYRMYEAEGKYTDPETICKKILARNLYGIDIDERAVQIARAALWMKAAERVFDFSGTPKNLIATNIRLPKGKDHLKAFLAKHPEDAPLQPALETILEGLAHADELGSLLQIEEPVERELRHLRERLGGQTMLSTGELTGQTSFAGAMTDEDWDAWKDGVIERLANHFEGEAEAADLVNAFFSQNAGKGVRLFELLSKRYDVVAANPPYMGSKNMEDFYKKYIQQYYLPGKRDLYCAFILRSLNLISKTGRLGMVTQQSWMFQKSYQDLRMKGEINNSRRNKNEFNGLLNDASIETLVHLGSDSFIEISGAVVNIVLFTLQNRANDKDHKIIAIRLIGKSYKDKKLLLEKLSFNSDYVYIVHQELIKQIPQSPLVYWLNTKLIEIMQNPNRLKDVSDVRQGIGCADTNRYIRNYWEAKWGPNDRWYPYVRGGGYQKWSELVFTAIEWRNSGVTIKESKSIIPSEKLYFREGVTYTDLACGSMSARYLPQGYIFSDGGPGIFGNNNDCWILSLLNSRIVTFILRVTCSSPLHFRMGYVANIPLPNDIPFQVAIMTKWNVLIKSMICNSNILEYNHSICPKILADQFILESLLLPVEHYLERIWFKAYDVNDQDIITIFNETGIPAGWHPLIATYDTTPPLSDDLPQIPHEVLDYLTEHERRNISSDDLTILKTNLRTLYEAGPGAKVDIEDDSSSADDEEEAVAGAYIPIPPETFLEELSQKLQIHPISVYWLLKEGIEQEGWRCIPEERRITEDRFTVMILRMLGHRWPKQIEAGEPVPDWADADGIIPLTDGTGEATLLERVRERIAAEFPGGSPAAIEREFEEVMGKSLEDWLHMEFFKHHIKQFKKRPIAWQVQSGRFTKKKQPAFACMVYYHKLDEDSLYKIKNQYVGPLRQKYETEIRGIEGIPVGSRTETQEKRYRELGELVAELKVFGDALAAVAENGFSSKVLDKIAKIEPLDAWCSIDGRRPAPADQDAFLRQEQSYIPDINDGVRVNIAPLQKAGLLAADVIAKKDLEKAISDRAEWRADERRWCREGKLPRCGWW